MIATLSDPQTDTYGKSILKWNSKLVGEESGKVYSKNGPYYGVIMDTGLLMDWSDPDRQVECRMVQANSMLLCQVSDHRGVNSYGGLLKMP